MNLYFVSRERYSNYKGDNYSNLIRRIRIVKQNNYVCNNYKIHGLFNICINSTYKNCIVDTFIIAIIIFFSKCGKIDFENSYLAHRIEQLFRSRLARWFHAFLLLDERHKRAPFASATVAEPPCSHFQTDPARVRTLGPFAPFGDFAKWIALRRNYIIFTLLLSPEIIYQSHVCVKNQIYLAADP